MKHGAVIPEIDEPHIHTSLVERKTGSLPSLRAVTDEADVLGPYTLIREIVRAPSAWLVEGRDTSGEPVLLQQARCRPATTAAELCERDYFEQRIAEQTAELAGEEGLSIRAHAATDRFDGTRVLFWVLPWDEELLSLAQVEPRVSSPAQLLEIGLALARRLARRHALGRVEPLLSEHLVLIRGSGHDAELAGVPIFLSPSWLEQQMQLSRLAPEEMQAMAPAQSGDLFRLGRTLTCLAQDLDELPESARDLFDRLAHPDPAQRTPRALDAIFELQAVLQCVEAELAAVPDEGPTHPPAASLVADLELGTDTARIEALDPELLASILAAPVDAATRFDSALPYGLLHGAEGAPVPVIEESPTAPGVEKEAPTAPGTRPFEERTEILAGAARDRAREEDRTLILTPSEPSTPWGDVAEPTYLPRNGDVAASGEETELEVRQAVRSAHTQALGPRETGDFPFPLPLEPIAIERKASPLPAKLGGNWAERRAAGIVLGMVVLAIAGAVLFAQRTLSESRSGAAALVVGPANEVLLDASPRDTWVVAEADGRVLGTTPMLFLVPPGTRPAVILVAADREPQRLVLPERGRISASLPGISDRSIDRCEGHLEAGVGVVHCKGDTLKRHEQHRPAEASITEPAGRSLFIDGRPAGTIPAKPTIAPAFTRVGVDVGNGARLERWVPVVPGLEIRMPPH